VRFRAAELRAQSDPIRYPIELAAPDVQSLMAEDSSNPSPLSISARSRAWLAATLAYVAFRAIPNLCYPMGRDQAT
jgi:hypothetical protein